MKEDLGLFDAPFFNMNVAEAAVSFSDVIYEDLG